MYEKFKTEELLECELTNEEYHERSDLLAKKNQERQRLESEKKAVTSEFSAKVNAAVAEINKLSLTISTRRESRNVKIEIKYNNPIVGQKTFIRADTKSVVRTMLMTDDEKQDLEINGLGDQEEVFIFIDKRECPLVEQAMCSADDAADWETFGMPQESSSLVEAPLDPKAGYRVVKGEDPENAGGFLYQLQKARTADDKPKRKGRKAKQEATTIEE